MSQTSAVQCPGFSGQGSVSRVQCPGFSGQANKNSWIQKTYILNLFTVLSL